MWRTRWPTGGPYTFLDARKRAMELAREMRWDPNRGCAEVGEDEAEVRRIVVDRILDGYVPDKDTGRPRPEDVSDHDNVLVTTLLQGAGKVVMVPTVSEAFGLYLREKGALPRSAPGRAPRRRGTARRG